MKPQRGQRTQTHDRSKNLGKYLHKAKEGKPKEEKPKYKYQDNPKSDDFVRG